MRVAVACLLVIAGCSKAREPSMIAADEALTSADPRLRTHDADAVRAAQRVLTSSNRRGTALVAVGEAWAQLALTSYDEGYSEHAAAAARLALDVWPDDPRAKTLLARTLLSSHRFQDAVDVRPNPDDARGWTVLADAYLELGKYDLAEAALLGAMQKEPSAQLEGRLAYLAWLRGQPSRALYTQALDHTADAELRAWLLSDRAAVAWHAGDCPTARADADAALQARPLYPAALIVRGRCTPESATDDFAKAYAQRQVVEPLVLLANAYAKAGDSAAAQATRTQALELASTSDPRSYGFLLLDTDAKRALAIADEELKTRGDALTHDLRARALAALGRNDEARAESMVAHGLAPLDTRLRAP